MSRLFLPTILLLSHIYLAGCAAVGDLPIMRATVHHKETVESNSMQNIRERVESLRNRFGADRVWVVFDIDNTVLTMQQLIGSDPWFSWQYQLLQAPQEKKRVARNLQHLLDIQRSLYSVSRMRLTEPDLPEFVRTLQGKGHPVMALTARNANMAPFTIRELNRHRISFAATSPSVPVQIANGKPPKGDQEWSALGFSDSEIAEFQLAKINRPVAYKNGVLHVSGQHKGALLRAVMTQAPELPKAVVFVDDQLRHVERVQSALAKFDMSVYTYRYGAVDIEVSSFEKGRGKVMASREWSILRKACTQQDRTRFTAMIRSIFDQVPPASDPKALCRLAF